MIKDVKNLSIKECQKEIFSAIKALSLDLVASWKTSSNNRLEIKLNRKEHALLAAELFMMSKATAGLIVLWQLNPRLIKREYGAYIEMPKLRTVCNRFTADVMIVGFKAADLLLEIMEAITRDLWAHHDTLEAIKAQRAEHKLNSKIRKADRKNAEMQKKITEEEQENKEVMAKGQCSRAFKELMQQTVDAAAKKAVKAERQRIQKIFGWRGSPSVRAHNEWSKGREETLESREDNHGSNCRRSSRIGNIRGVVCQGVDPVRGMDGAQCRAKSAPTRATLPQKTQGRTLGANGRAAKAVTAGVVAVAVAVATVAADAATGVKTKENKGASLAEQTGQILGK